MNIKELSHHYLTLADMSNSDEQRNYNLLQLEKLLTKTRVDRGIAAQKKVEEEAAQRLIFERCHSVAEIETCLEAFLIERKFQRSKCSMHYNLGSEDEDRAFSTQFRNRLRKCLKLLTL